MAQIGTDITHAKQLLEAGNVVAIPTETVYGLAANALNRDAIVKVFEAKNRPSFDPLIVHVPSKGAALDLADSIPKKAEQLMDAFWPGPLTLVLPKKDVIPDLCTSGLKTVGLRVPNLPLTLELLETLDYPLAAPSANPFGYVSPTTAQHVNDQLGEKLPYILDGGPTTVGLESTIVGFVDDDPIVYRLGGISVEDLESVVGSLKVELNTSSNPKAPGMLKSHYSPSVPLFLGDISKNSAKHQTKKAGVLSFSGIEVDCAHQAVLSKAGNMNEAAANLFRHLRSFEGMELDVILAEEVPDEGLGRAINDRLRRASC